MKNRYLNTLKSLEKMSKSSLVRLITNSLKKLPKRKLARIAYEVSKATLPMFKQTGRARYSLRPDTPEYALMIQQFGEEGFSQMNLKERQKEARKLFTKERAKVRAFKRKTKRKFSPKQLAAQRLFAKRAKAGTLRKRR